MPKTKKKGAKKRPQRMELSRFPPAFTYNPLRQNKFRFAAISDVVDSVINRRSLLNLLFVAGDTTTGLPIMGAARVLKVELWGIDDGKSLAGQDPLALTWGGGTATFGGPARTVQAYGNAMAPAHISCVPPKGSQAEAWIPPAGSIDPLFLVTCGSGTVLDVTVEWVLYDTSIGTASMLTITGGTVGQWYQNYLDNSASGPLAGPNNWAPAGPWTTKSGFR